MPNRTIRAFAIPSLFFAAAVLAVLAASSRGPRPGPAARSGGPVPDPVTCVWSGRPADKWENAYPVGNGRLGAMVFGRTDEERIQLNEDTYWTGGPYSTTVEGGAEALPELRRLIFEERFKEAHILFGRRFLGYPVEQQKYQSLGSLVLAFPSKAETADYRHELDLDAAVDTTSYTLDGVRFTRRVFSSPVDQVVVVRLEAGAPGRISFRAQLRGERNDAHSNYATDYFRMDGAAPDGLVVRGKSADYMGVTGRLRYEARLRARPEGGTVAVEGDELVVAGADAVTLLIAAATNFVNYKDVSGDPAARVAAALDGAVRKPFDSPPRGPPPRASPALPAGRDRAPARAGLGPPDRRAHQGLRRDERSGPGRAGPSVRPLPPHLVVAAGDAAGQPPGPVERQDESPLGFEVHDQHQHRDELLAGRGRQPGRVRRAALPHGPGARRSGRRCRPRTLRRPRLGFPPEHGSLARRGAHGRPELGRRSRPAGPGWRRTCSNITFSPAIKTSSRSTTRS